MQTGPHAIFIKNKSNEQMCPIRQFGVADLVTRTTVECLPLFLRLREVQCSTLES
jgi:hypothetical protein